MWHTPVWHHHAGADFSPFHTACLMWDCCACLTLLCVCVWMPHRCIRESKLIHLSDRIGGSNSTGTSVLYEWVNQSRGTTKLRLWCLDDMLCVGLKINKQHLEANGKKKKSSQESLEIVKTMQRLGTTYPPSRGQVVVMSFHCSQSAAHCEKRHSDAAVFLSRPFWLQIASVLIPFCSVMMLLRCSEWMNKGNAFKGELLTIGPALIFWLF